MDKPKRIAGTWYVLAEEEGKDSLESQLGVNPIVLYTTSMRAVRKTFDQCNTCTRRHLAERHFKRHRLSSCPTEN